MHHLKNIFKTKNPLMSVHQGIVTIEFKIEGAF